MINVFDKHVLVMRLQENVILVDGAIALLLVESKDTNDNQQQQQYSDTNDPHFY